MNDIKEALQFLESITEIPSGSLNPQGVMKVQEQLANYLEALGFEIHWVDSSLKGQSTARLLDARRKGQSDAWISFVSHADTLDFGIAADKKILLKRESEQLVAPGILDDKASQVVGLWAITQYIRSQPTPKFGIRFTSSPNEELGSPGFAAFYEELSKASALALGLEPAYQGRDIVKERRGNRWYDVEVIGKEAHSGRDPDKGLSALHDLCNKVTKLVKLNKISKGLSLNVGEITSDNPTYNLVAGRATAKVDLRFLDVKSRDRSHRKIVKILRESTLKKLKTGERTQTRFQIVDDCPPLKANRESERLAAQYLAILSAVEKRADVQAVRSGGAADVSYMARKRLPILDGLGACGGNMHRKDEFVIIPSIESRAQSLQRFLTKLDSGELGL